MADLSDQPLGLLCEVARRELVHLLESLPGNKDLIVDAGLLRPLDRIASMSLLQKHGCGRVIPLRGDAAIPWDPAVTRRVYLIRSCIEMARMLSQHVRAAPQGKHIAAIWVDRRLVICERELERQGVHGLLESFELNLCLLPLESDLFSLELPISSRPDLFSAANAIFQLQSLYGLIPTVYGLGEQAEKMWKLLRVLYAERGEPRASPDQPISHIYVFDRGIDHASVLMTGLTYEAMLHDVFTISCGKITFGPEVEGRMKPEPGGQGDVPAAARKPKVYVLDNNDGVFASVRNKHMIGVFSFLSAKAKEIQSSYDKGASIEQVQDMKHFVAHELKQLKLQHRQLEMHICACEVLQQKNGAVGATDRLKFEQELVAGTANVGDVHAYLEDCMLREQSPWHVLSLACLASISLNGLPAKVYSGFRDYFLRSYGYEYLPILATLGLKKLLMEKPKTVGALAPAGILPQQGAAEGYPTFPFLCKRLNLTPTEEPSQDLKNPTKMNYVFSGAYTPAFCQVVADSMVHGWNTTELKKTFGRVMVEENSYTPADRRPDNRMRKAILVFFLGGVTYAEVAALRLLAVQNNFRVLIATTNIINREAYLRCLAEADPKPLA